MALGSIRLPQATTVSAARIMAPGPDQLSAARPALRRARRNACTRGSSALSGVSSISAGQTASGVMPTWASSASRLGLALARTSSGLFEAIGDAPLGKVIRRHLDEYLVAGQHANAVLAH